MDRQRICIAGGTGFLGRALAQHFSRRGWEVVILSRRAGETVPGGRTVAWDARTEGPWVDEVRASDVLVNLAGRSVNCRYNAENRKAIYDSRLESTAILDKVLRADPGRVRVWMNAATATIYRHAVDRPQDEITGEITDDTVIAGTPPSERTRVAPGWDETWSFSVDVAKKWEAALFTDDGTGRDPQRTPVRKVALRIAIALGNYPDSAFDMFNRVVGLGIGGTIMPGTQRLSWIHERDFCRAIEFLVDRDDLAGPVNLAAPNALTNRDFMKTFRKVRRRPFGAPALMWMMRVATRVLRTEAELVFKSRWVYPKRLLDAGFRFEFTDVEPALRDLCGVK
jgi:NAD dependent epimerase/dehydratase family enzyme